jgi:hypothetical protein
MNGWRDSMANALDDQANTVDIAHDALQHAITVLEQRNRQDACTELWAAASTLRLERDTITSEASALRVTPSREQLPMTLTTRHPRGRRNDHHLLEKAADGDG